MVLVVESPEAKAEQTDPSLRKRPEKREEPVKPRLSLKQRVLTTLLVIVLTLVFAEIAARFIVVQAKPYQTSFLELDRKFQLAQQPLADKRPLIIILGDSFIDFALYPELLTNRLSTAGLDYQVRNIATPGNTMDMNLFLLQKSLDKGVKPKTVMVNIHPRLLNKNFDVVKKEAPLLKSYVGQCEFKKPQDPTGQVSCFLQSQSYLIRHRRFFKDELLKLPVTLFSPESRMVYEPVRYPQNEISPGGWAPGYEVFTEAGFAEKHASQKALKRAASDLANFVWTDENYRKLQAFCKQHGIQLILVWLPEHRLMQTYYKHYNISFSQLQTHMVDYARREQLPYVNLQNAVAPTESYINPDHVNAVGAITVTQLLADRLVSDRILAPAKAVVTAGIEEKRR